MRRPIFLGIFLTALLLGQTGCLFRTRVVEMRTSTAKLQDATKQQLVDRINQDAAAVKSLNATVEHCHFRGRRKERQSHRFSGNHAATF